MWEWLTLSNINIVVSWIEKWYKSDNRTSDFSKIRKHLTMRQIFLLRCMDEYGSPHYASFFAPALANWDGDRTNAGWKKASEYACQYLATLSLINPSGNEVEVSELGRAFLDAEKRHPRSREVFDKTPPKLRR